MQYQLKSKLAADECAQRLSAQIGLEFGLREETSRIVASRGVANLEEARRYLQPSPADLNEPFAFRDMKKAVSLIGNTIAKGDKILVYGDYDADGITASAIICLTLQKMGANVTVFLPSRNGHGYGLAEETLEQYRDHALLLTVDCGISNVGEVRRAHELGMRTIITDHHTCPEHLPEADCILNPKRPGESYPFAELCGAGVAFKLAQALIGEEAFAFVDLAAIGTIADLVPLEEENRTIASLGISKFNSDPNLGLRILLESLKGSSVRLDAEMVGFSLAPCINAAGRMSTAKLAFDLITASNPAIARVLSQSLSELNTRRKNRQKEICDEVEARISRMDRLPPILVLHDETWEAGLMGLAAGRVAEQHGRPAILLGKSDSRYVGSARSTAQINIYDALHSVEHLLVKFGGHSAAAGLTVEEENVEALAEGLEEYVEALAVPEEEPVLAYDLELPLPIDEALVAEFAVLEPCGISNPKPQILVRGAAVTEAKALSDGAHAAFCLRTAAGRLDAIAFSCKAETLPKQADAVGPVVMSDYTGRPQMIVSALSCPDPAEAPFQHAVKYVLRAKHPKDAARFFCDKQKLGTIYAAIRRIVRQAGPQTCAQLFAAVTAFVPGITLHQFAFALAVFGDLKLLRGIRNARIEVTPPVEKRHLEDSTIFCIFEELSHGSQGKN